jgi:hypothetical protein
MAYTTGTATNYLDLLAKLRDYLVSNGWQVIAGATSGTPVPNDYISFKGVGLAGDDEILFTVQAIQSVTGGYYNLLINGHTGYNSQLPGMAQSGNHLLPVCMPLLNSAIPYWFIVNPRCIKIVCRVNGRYDCAYVGLILPDHAPTDWAYPMFVGASSAISTQVASANASDHTNFWQPYNADGQNDPTKATQAYLLTPGGAWRAFGNTATSSAAVTGCLVFPWATTLMSSDTMRALDGQAWLTRGALLQVGDGSGSNVGGANTTAAPDGGNWYGSFDGVFYTPSFGATVEEIVTENGVDHLLVGNVNRVSDSNFAAFALE